MYKSIVLKNFTTVAKLLSLLKRNHWLRLVEKAALQLL